MPGSPRCSEGERARGGGCRRRRRPGRRGRGDRRRVRDRRLRLGQPPRGGPPVGNPAEPLVRALVERVGEDGALCSSRGRRARTSWTPPRCSSRVGARPRPPTTSPARRRRLRGARARAPRHADGGADAAAARRSDDVRAQGGRLARRGDGRARRGWRTCAPAGSPRSSAVRRDALRPGRARRRGRPRSQRELDLSSRRILLAHEPRADPELGAALDRGRGVARRSALDLELLAQTEVGEVREVGDGGGSSAMPHKQNPVGAMWARAAAELGRGHASVLTAALVAEHERGRIAWQAEWDALPSALAATGGAAAALADALEALEVDPIADAGEPRADRWPRSPPSGSRSSSPSGWAERRRGIAGEASLRASETGARSRTPRRSRPASRPTSSAPRSTRRRTSARRAPSSTGPRPLRRRAGKR